MNAETYSQFVAVFNALAEDVHQNARAKGWYEQREALIAATGENNALREFAEMALGGLTLALIHSEVSEALENQRLGGVPDDKIPEFSGVEAELADVVIRIMDTAACNGLRVAEAIIAKMEMNRGREHKHGGKLA